MRVILASVIALILCIVSVPNTVRADAEDTAWLLGQINALRQRNGLAPLAPNPQLIAAANAHSTYLANNPWVDAHREENGSTPQSRALAAGYAGRVSENVAGGSNANAEWVFNWWMNSTVHRNNMLHSNWTEIGIGFAKGPRGRFYTLVFGNQAESLPRPVVQPTTAAPPQDSPATQPPGAAASTSVPKPASPTRRPPTRAPTATPTLTFTPSITYSPRPSFTPSQTPTGLPPTSTAIVLEVSPQASPAPTDASPQKSATPGVTALAVAALAAVAQDPRPPAAPQTETTPASAIRSLIPWLLGLQVVVGGGLMVSSIFRRRRR